MRLNELRPGWRTDFPLHRFGAEVAERPDCIVVRTPANPTFYWGNCLILPAGPADADLAHWLARFEEEVARGQPLTQHVAIGVNGPYRGETLPAWEAAGFELSVSAVLHLDAESLVPPPRPPRGAVQVRPIDFGREVQAVVDLECVETHGFEPVAYRAYRLQQFERYALMQAQGLAQWFGVWCDGVLAADCGLMRDAAEPGATGRFQRVATHPAWRRRGLCSALIHHVSRYGFAQWALSETVIVADPDDVAFGIYRSLGYQATETEWCLQRNAPQDAPA